MKNDDNTFTFVGEFKPVELQGVEITGEKKKLELESVKLIAGKFNNCNTVCYWNIDEDMDFEIGDYAIVENKNDYDLVKIIGVIYTVEKYKKFISNCNVSKKVVSIIPREEIRED